MWRACDESATPSASGLAAAALRVAGRGPGGRAVQSARHSAGCQCPRGAFSHVVAYTRPTSALRGTADTLLDAAWYGTTLGLAFSCSRCRRGPGGRLFPRRSPAGSGPPPLRDLGPDFQVGRWLVTAGPWPGRAGPDRASGCVHFGSRVATVLVYELGRRKIIDYPSQCPHLTYLNREIQYL